LARDSFAADGAQRRPPVDFCQGRLLAFGSASLNSPGIHSGAGMREESHVFDDGKQQH
jgi:hypothetical protein